MPLVTSNQFNTNIDPVGSISRGLSNRVMTQEMDNKQRLQGLAEQQKQTRLNAQGLRGADPSKDTQEQSRARMIAEDHVEAARFLNTIGIDSAAKREEAAAFANNVRSVTSREEKNKLINERSLKLESQGRDASHTRMLIELDDGQLDNALAGFEAAALTANQRATIPSKEEASRIRREAFNLKKDAAELRSLEAITARETNSLRRQELELKINQKKKDIIQKERDVEFNNKSALDSLSNSITTIDRMLEGDLLESAAGFQANFPTFAGTDSANFEAMLETFQSQAFLSQVEKMKGMGALSENEGKKLGAALGSLSINMGDKALRKELLRIKDMLILAKQRMAKKFGIKSESKGGEDAPLQVNVPKEDITEDDIIETMRANNMTREQVISRMGGQ